MGSTWAVTTGGVLAGVIGVAVAQVPAPASGELEPVLITGARADRTSSGATGLDLAIKETPQSISVVTSELMDDWAANNINEALRLTTGINVEEWETNRTNFMARGFEIKSTQIDGIGLPNNWGIVTGAVDTFGFEKLEVIRGANGLLTGVGNASGTINYVRKRPTNEPRALVEVTGGSWDFRRVEADASLPLVASGAWAARVVAAVEDKDSYLRGLSNGRKYFYGVIDGQIGERTTLTAGYSFQDTDTDGNLWGALSLSNSDGTQAEFDRSASTTQDWTYWDRTQHTAFAELAVALGGDWMLKATTNYRSHQEDDQLFFAYSATGLDPVTGAGLVGWPGKFTGHDHAWLGDLTASGHYTLFGREHEATVGVSSATSEDVLYTFEVPPGEPASGPLPPFPYAGDATPEPAWGARGLSGTMNQRMRRFYGATRVQLGDRMKAVLGFNLAEYHRDGIESGAAFDQTERELSPYAGLTFDLTGTLLAYASYSDIYQPQDQYDIDRVYLDPSRGVNYEAGLKGEWLDRKLLTTLAVFRAEQQGLATFAGVDSNAQYYYEGQDVESTGAEIEVTGRIGDYVTLTAGFTALKLEDEDGLDTYTWVPRRTVNFTVSSKLPALPAVSLGVGGRWQSDIETLDGYTSGVVAQDSYLTLNAFGRWDVSPQVTVRANVSNITNEKYIGSLYQVGYYAAPRNYSLSLGYRFRP